MTHLPHRDRDALDRLVSRDLQRIPLEQLEATSRLVKEPLRWKFDGHTIQLDVDVPPYAVAAIL